MRLSKKPVIARRPNGPTWQSVPKTHEYQHISGFWITDSHVAALLGMTETGLLTRYAADAALPPFTRGAVFLFDQAPLSKGAGIAAGDDWRILQQYFYYAKKAAGCKAANLPIRHTPCPAA